MGRASNRKRAQRQAGPGSRPASQDAESRALPPELVLGLGAMVEEARLRVEREYATRQIWFGSTEPVAAELPPWPENSLGDRFLVGYLGEVQDAPSLLTADIPDAAVITADPAHWNIAVSALIRAVIFDGLPLGQPAVRALLEVLAPIVAAEQAYARAMDGPFISIGPYDDDDEEDFPELDGPVFLLGGRALVEATWTAVGDDPLSDVLGVLRTALDGTVPGLDSQVLADALIGAFARHYRIERSADIEVLERIGLRGGNALEDLVTDKVIPPGDVLTTGLTMLSALARLCLSDSASILQPT
jgi:hypothetical protein